MHCLVSARNKQWKHWNTRRNGKCWQLETLDFGPRCHSLSQTIWQGWNLKLDSLDSFPLFNPQLSAAPGLGSRTPTSACRVQAWVGTRGPQAGCSWWAAPRHRQWGRGWAGTGQGCPDEAIPWPRQGDKANGSAGANPHRRPCCVSSAAHTCRGAAGSTPGHCHLLLPENSSFWFSPHQLWAICIWYWQDQRASISGQAPVASVLKNDVAGV